VADAVTDVDHRRDLVVEPGEVLRHRAVDAAEIVGLADEVSQMRRPPLPSTRVTNSLMVHSAGAVQLPNAWSRLSVPLRFSFGSLPGRAVHSTTNFMLSPLVCPIRARLSEACRSSGEAVER
jgi:hypothetical protein